MPALRSLSASIVRAFLAACATPQVAPVAVGPRTPSRGERVIVTLQVGTGLTVAGQ